MSGRTSENDSQLPIIIIGGGGHAKVLYECLLLSNRKVIALADPKAGDWTRKMSGLQILKSDEEVFKFSASGHQLVNAVGSTKSMAMRQGVYEKFTAAGYSFANVNHPNAIISPSASLAPGVQVMAGAIVQVDTVIGSNSIINTGVRVDHDCTIGEHVHIASGAVLSGTVSVGAGTHIGTGAVIIHSITIGEGCLIAAGAVVTRDVLDATSVAGVPAKKMNVII